MKLRALPRMATISLIAACPYLHAQHANLNISAQAGYDNTIITSDVDGNGNPNFLGTSVSNTVLPINGGNTCSSPLQSCPLAMMIAGQYQVLNTNITITLPSTAGEYFIYAVQDLTNANMVQPPDFGSTNIPPLYQYGVPTCSSAAGTSNPHIWFDLSTNLMKTCTVASGSFSAQPLIVIGVADVNGSGHIDQSLCEPYRLNPYRRVELFGAGSDGTITSATSGSPVDGWKQLNQLYLSGSQTLTHSSWTTTEPTPGLVLFSQNPMMILNGATVTASGLGRVSVPGNAAGTAPAGGNGGCAGGGGGGGGSTAHAGGQGGSRFAWSASFGAGAGTAGSTSPAAGGNGGYETISTSTPVYPNLREVMPIACVGASGGAGGGDGTNAGGSGGAGGGVILLRAPSILVDSASSVLANGSNGGTGAGGTAAGGGGGGGGTAVLQGIFTNQGGTFQANGGLVGSGVGTGKAGGSGGNGLAITVKLQ